LFRKEESGKISLDAMSHEERRGLILLSSAHLAVAGEALPLHRLNFR